ncbi:MAG: Maf family protein [Lachnospirales bacterium]
MILASSSKQRKLLMEELFDDFLCKPVDIDETFDKALSVYENVKNVAYSKGLESIKINNIQNDIVISLDTIVYCDNKVLLKPKSYDEAFNMIKSYEDSSQEVITGIGFFIVKNGKIVKEYKENVVSKVNFTNLSDEKIHMWLEQDLYRYCSGGFMIEKVEKSLGVKIDGSYFNVIGVPIERIKEILIENDIEFKM